MYTLKKYLSGAEYYSGHLGHQREESQERGFVIGTLSHPEIHFFKLSSDSQK